MTFVKTGCKEILISGRGVLYDMHDVELWQAELIAEGCN